jgi:hypothetical protein
MPGINGLSKIFIALLLVFSLTGFLCEDQEDDEATCSDAINNAYGVMDEAYNSSSDYHDDICWFLDDVDNYLWAQFGSGLPGWPGGAACASDPTSVLPFYIYDNDIKNEFLDWCKSDWTREAIDCNAEADTIDELEDCIGI